MIPWLMLFLALQSSLIVNCFVVVAPDNVSMPESLEEDYDQSCKRNCTTDGPNKICNYYFEIEHYFTMSKACYNCPQNISDCFRPDCISADGIKRPIVVANRKLPGPSIEVCLGDTVIVHVHNNMAAESTSVHWHGQHQKLFPYMDGVPHLTQCPIPPGDTFRYEFVADTGGTHFWHSHIGMQRGDGLFGPMIVNVPAEDDPNYHLADFDEHRIIVSDWVDMSSTEKFLSHHHAGGDNKITSILINGLGRFQMGRNNSLINMPTSTYVVKQNYTYRFRLINAEFLNCPIEILIDNHTMTIVATDGNPIQPIETHSLVSYAGERFDFIINANKKIDNYWIRFRGLMDCDRRFHSVFQVAILRYEGAPNKDPKDNVTYDNDLKNSKNVKTKQVNPLNKGIESNDTINVVKLKANGYYDDILTQKVDHKFFISYDFYEQDNSVFHRKKLYGFHQVLKKEERIYTPQLNHISMKMPSFPLLTQPSLIEPNLFCNSSTVKNCLEEFCSCTHVLQVKLNSIVEIILTDEGVIYDANHPFHLHGHNFRVIGMERLGSNVTTKTIMDLDKKGLLKRNLHQAPIKDTVTVPDGGYTIIRFKADNPGFWLFHCHIEFHSEIGMALIFKVGEYEDFVPVPNHFPRCGNYEPDPSESMNSESNQFENEISHMDSHKSYYQNLKQTLIEVMKEMKLTSGSVSSIQIQYYLLSVCLIAIMTSNFAS